MSDCLNYSTKNLRPGVGTVGLDTSEPFRILGDIYPESSHNITWLKTRLAWQVERGIITDKL